MKVYTIIALAITALAAPPRMSHATPLSDFAGSYAKRSSVTLTQSGKVLARGTVRLRLRSNPAGTSGRLSISGRFRLDGAIRPYSEFVTFGRKGAASLSNLAPGYEDGQRATGTRLLGSSSITANFPFQIRTTSGAVSLEIRRVSQGATPRLRIVQTLTTTASSAPVVWTFSAAAAR